jgi:hypothetical protein
MSNGNTATKKIVTLEDIVDTTYPPTPELVKRLISPGEIVLLSEDKKKTSLFLLSNLRLTFLAANRFSASMTLLKSVSFTWTTRTVLVTSKIEPQI